MLDAAPLAMHRLACFSRSVPRTAHDLYLACHTLAAAFVSGLDSTFPVAFSILTVRRNFFASDVRHASATDRCALKNFRAPGIADRIALRRLASSSSLASRALCARNSSNSFCS